MFLGMLAHNQHHKFHDILATLVSIDKTLHGDPQRVSNIGHISKSGCCLVVKEKLIHLKQLK
jgi:hypothetical protein